MQKKTNKIRTFWTTKVQPLCKCNKFMLNLEQVAFNIIEERVEKTRMLGEKEHLCHCYACCQVTTAIRCAVHGNRAWKTSSHLGKKKWGRNDGFHTSERGLRVAFSLGFTIIVYIANVFDNEINFTSHYGWVLIHLTWGWTQILRLWAAQRRLSSSGPNINRIINGLEAFKRSSNTLCQLLTSMPFEHSPHFFFWSFHFASAHHLQRRSHSSVITSASVSRAEKNFRFPLS